MIEPVFCTCTIYKSIKLFSGIDHVLINHLTLNLLISTPVELDTSQNLDTQCS